MFCLRIYSSLLDLVYTGLHINGKPSLELNGISRKNVIHFIYIYIYINIFSFIFGVE
jgi:hypothetical protein